ncbi:MAG: hypothetical protein JSW16_00140 [Dehalococcoidales bacterium]|nr:MAG: hypothetical protein JSW16_00140 [Dehalococcoidales bacterium]
MNEQNQTPYDFDWQRELDAITTAIQLEDVMDFASGQLEIDEILEEAKQYGEHYGSGFEDGFWRGYQYWQDRNSARVNSIQEKHEALNRRWEWSQD